MSTKPYLLNAVLISITVCTLAFAYIGKGMWSYPPLIENYSYTTSAERAYNHHRVAVFASYSPRGSIPEYVIYYLKELKKVSDVIIFIADNPLHPSEADKIKDLVDHIECRRHGEYDFGSYKRGLAYLRANLLLDKQDSLILANDSCYGPIFPLSPILNRMDQEMDADFYGLISNTEYNYHLQSYFLVFSPKILRTTDLDNFLSHIRKEDSKIEIIKKYEVGLTTHLTALGYRSKSYVPDTIKTDSEQDIRWNKLSFPNTLIIKYHFPFIKRYNFSPDQELNEKPTEALNSIRVLNPELWAIIKSDIFFKALVSKF
ncbi:MAG: hypothetical protein IJV07_02725 [Alphaproteobacteria bacterium]|nr:hypothetical protein [Alphaproteobacteria bacterium]